MKTATKPKRIEQFNLRIDADLCERLRVIAAKTKVPMVRDIEPLLREHADRAERRLAARN
jgi:predicted HicB family RNase H-like nuclease